ncbi:invasion associated locus B family protein [Stappia sp. GBMRC 2046]|uniref:Invasion associated locus B family protein n=1 Tax=Stappia sediminis TaxID=2692190 RepID=A0A7X3S7B5_9HYPH|nr:invasion associated locus B family protein [Stappia sediminis]MXN64606.1 invasion associated locus B family protein [Stappia sediminis]
MARKFKRGLAILALGSIASLSMVTGAAAQEVTPGEESPWIKVCNTDPKANKDVCLITQELRTDTGQFLASVALREISGEARKTLLIAVPPGMLIQPGLRVQVDSGKQTEAKYGICFPNACYSELVVDDNFIGSMKKGGALKLTTLNQQAKPVPFELSLIGFTKIYEGEPIDPAALQQREQKLQSELQKRAEEARQKLIEKQKEVTGN